MRSSNDQKLGEAIKDMLKLYHLDEKLDEHKLVRSWEKVVGPMISKHTTEIYISNSKLYVTIDSAPLRQEMSYSLSKIIKDLNAMVGAQVVNELILR
jgi:predicted nucleic acid-binding Zn ribbon protein